MGPADGPAAATAWVREQLAELGFDAVGVARADRAPHADAFQRALEQGWLEPLPYLRERVPQRLDPRALLPGARSVVVVAMGYREPPLPPPPEPYFRVARYAARRDYHLAMTKGLRKLRRRMNTRFPGSDGYVASDTGAVLERDWAAHAGLGWVGKSGMLLSRTLGTWTVLGTLVTTVDLVPDAPETDHCGRCTACLDACPTGALRGPRELDARQCISTWTVEWRAAEFPAGVPPFHGWVFGCDVCQEVCPYQGRGVLNPALRPRHDLAYVARSHLGENPKASMADLEGTPLARAGAQRLTRNARSREP